MGSLTLNSLTEQIVFQVTCSSMSQFTPSTSLSLSLSLNALKVFHNAQGQFVPVQRMSQLKQLLRQSCGGYGNSCPPLRDQRVNNILLIHLLRRPLLSPPLQLLHLPAHPLPLHHLLRHFVLRLFLKPNSTAEGWARCRP